MWWGCEGVKLAFAQMLSRPLILINIHVTSSVGQLEGKFLLYVGITVFFFLCKFAYFQLYRSGHQALQRNLIPILWIYPAVMWTWSKLTKCSDAYHKVPISYSESLYKTIHRNTIRSKYFLFHSGLGNFHFIIWGDSKLIHSPFSVIELNSLFFATEVKNDVCGKRQRFAFAV